MTEFDTAPESHQCAYDENSPELLTSRHGERWMPEEDALVLAYTFLADDGNGIGTRGKGR